MLKINIKNNINSLNLRANITNRLLKHNITTIESLWHLKRKDLKLLDFSNEEINYIIIQLQLLGLDLNKKTY